MVKKRKRHGAEFKAKVALEALKGVKTVNELSSTSAFAAIISTRESLPLPAQRESAPISVMTAFQEHFFSYLLAAQG